MEKNYKIILVTLIAAGVIGCVKAPHGFLSSQIRYRDNPIQVQRGIIVQSIAVDNDGSSAPVTYQLLDIRDAVTHKHADSLYKNRDRYVYTSEFDPDVDTTVALLNSIRKNVNLPSFDFNTHTGAFTFYNTTANVPLGAYEFDIAASNENGSKTFKSIANLNFYEGDVAEIDAGGGAWFQDGTTTSGDIGEPKVTITKLSSKGTLAILKIVDENGVAFNPKNGEYIKRGDRSSFETFAKFHPLIASDTSLTCNFEVTPFPVKGAAQGFTIYYRIPSQFVRIDPGFTPTPAKIYSANPRFTFRLFQEGVYLITVKLQHVTRNLN
ncbi:hypothetical protein SAMN05428975_1807 [Mucilaginibacter sp. OK268]|uniref:DUF5007 domain-containing protein n=1 Tax=Mucilaginibacter sp. OK268 TaxID=1881048 RepID=UPI000887E8D7|nr:DUF5007 domain-containing protein [Mucilaginibacter sp. OK268]SDP56051.1 hypothetical protein SAMN05428975_1807 [Mucilaginibacter sp. OK268]